MLGLKKWKSFKIFFETDKKALMEPFDFHGNTAVHVAARSNDPKLLTALLEMLSASERWRVLRKKNDHQNTLLHEVPYCSNVKMADVVFKFEKDLPSPEEEISDESKRPLLEIKNDFGETPVFRAAKHGNLRVLKHMANHVVDLEKHFHREEDKTSILHVAVLGQYFATHHVSISTLRCRCSSRSLSTVPESLLSAIAGSHAEKGYHARQC